MPVLYTKGNKYGASSQTVKEVTKAEYDALPEEEKMNGVIYMVVDEDGSESVHVVDEIADDASSVPTSRAVFSALDIKNLPTGTPQDTDAFMVDSANGKKKLDYYNLKQSLIGDGFGSAEIKYLSQAEYDDLPEDKKNSLIPYYIYDAPGVQQEFKELSLAEYNKLSKAEQEDGTFYYITDDNEVPAYQVSQTITNDADKVPSCAAVKGLIKTRTYTNTSLGMNGSFNTGLLTTNALILGAYSPTVNGLDCVPFVNNTNMWYVNVFLEKDPHTNNANTTCTITIIYIDL